MALPFHGGAGMADKRAASAGQAASDNPTAREKAMSPVMRLESEQVAARIFLTADADHRLMRAHTTGLMA
jgi:hypothetical protein